MQISRIPLESAYSMPNRMVSLNQLRDLRPRSKLEYAIHFSFVDFVVDIQTNDAC